MAIVWAARLRGTHGFSKVVALKTMKPSLSSDPRFEKMFLRESELAARIKHPNVCEVFDLGEDRGIVYLVMDAVDGESLSQLDATSRALGRAIPNGVIARLVAQSARGLHAAHMLKSESGAPSGIIHRDVSPQNILVTCEGLVKVVDFGVARAAERGERTEHHTAADVIKGKVSYLAPEQIEGGTIDGRVDVFALGIVLHQLLSGTLPFTGENDLATLLSIASADPAPPLPDACPAELRAIVTRALEKDPDKRYPSMRELANALEAFAASEAHGEDEVSAFVTGVLGPRRETWRRALRDVARNADAKPADATPVDLKAADTGADPRPVVVAARQPPSRVLLAVVLGVAALLAGLFFLREGRAPVRPAVVATPTAPVATAGPDPIPLPTPSAAPPPPPASAAPRVLQASVPPTPGPSVKRSAPSSSGRAAPAASTTRKGPLDGWD